MKRLEELGISPAPWKVDYSDDIDRVVNILDANSGIIVETDYGVYPPELPDARLIAAAPKLYQALYKITKEQECGKDCSKCKNDLCVIQECRAALAEAAGEEMDDGNR